MRVAANCAVPHARRELVAQIGLEISVGLKLRYNLFYKVSPADVYSSYWHFYSLQHAALIDKNDLFERYELYEPNAGWAILSWNAGWEWEIRRAAQLFVSKELQCPGFLIFVYDGDYWGYELFKDGTVLDHFVSNMDEGKWHFPDDPCTGNAQLLATYLDWLSASDIVPYLVQYPDFDGTDLPKFQRYEAELDIPPRPGDEFSRFSDLAALNFLRLLGIRIGVVNGYVTPQTPLWRQFGINIPT